ncbi:solute carrier family 25 member 36-A-like isoform X2 [Amphiura filiformis]|uniref:solute carrier family 25 member 36-A-like isoform X2 n=1 Tax=Amphiura filiformis TaxID=82378 RepID=UPI003B21AE82
MVLWIGATARTGGTVGALITCPLEVVKTRLQASTSRAKLAKVSGSKRSAGVIFALRHIVKSEGIGALFRGLGPNLLGIAPSRAIYFGAYARGKSFFNSTFKPESPQVHLCSAGFAGFTACTITNPIWFVKTRLQLDTTHGAYRNSWQCIRYTYKNDGLRGFYKGVSASYVGISETVIHFVIYEQLKQLFRKYHNIEHKNFLDFLSFMGAAAISKTTASCLAYPHEVARTRLREHGTKYRSFVQTLRTVAVEEGFFALYGGLFAHLVRQIPNTAIVMVTYETVVYVLSQV